jgi:nucleoside 2-deoxyribosyltransferase
MAEYCPICDSPSQSEAFHNDGAKLVEVRCLRCGEYRIDDITKEIIERALSLDDAGIRQHLRKGDSSDYYSEVALCIEVARKAANGRGIDIPRSIISHVLRNRMDKRALISSDILVNILKNNSMLRPAEQASNFVNYLGRSLSSPGESFQVPDQNLQQSRDNVYGLLGIKIGTSEWNDLYFIITSLENQGIVNVQYQSGITTSGDRKLPLRVSLTLAGWQKYEELQRSVKNSRKAFVAMEFIDSDKTAENYFFQNTLLDKYLVPAVKETGYDLANSMMSEPTAGNIHARLEVEIRAARFIIAELSHHNNGAYWEAGFARGLEKPVIYMYNKKIGKAETHFDVGSDHIIYWEEDKPEKAAEELKAVIRATLFGEAVMED